MEHKQLSNMPEEFYGTVEICEDTPGSAEPDAHIREKIPRIIFEPAKKGGFANVTLKDQVGKDSILLNMTFHYISICDSNGSPEINLETKEGPGARITVGSSTRPGLIAVRDGKGKDSVTLDGVTGKVICRDLNGKDSIVLDCSAGDIFLSNSDCAEDFDISDSPELEPGTVMVIEDEGKLLESSIPYDKRVAGVISGAGDYKPGIVLDKKPLQSNRKPIALMGKAYCKVDAQFSPVEVGDLLTTSSTAGHAMKAQDPYRAFGAVIGKALRSINSGTGLIPILIALQ